MRINEVITEAFNQPYPFKWEKGEFGDLDALAKLEDGTNLSIMFNLADMAENDWGVEFYRNNSQSVTGEGDAQRVFATVLTAIGQFIKKKKPNTLFFTAVKEEDPTGSREKLYDRLVQRYATGLGYDLQKVEYPEQTGYKLTRKEQKELTESLSRVAYHYTNTIAALKILQSGQFQLSSALGSVEQQYMPKGRPYFMSTTRTKTGGYHQGGMRRGVLFVLDGNWFNQHYKSGPIDYWGGRGTSLRPSEAEDRVYSAEPTIPIGGVIGVHVFFDVENEDNEEQRAHDQSIIREILIAAKTQGIPAFYYTDKNAWLALDTRKVADVRQLTGSRKPSWYRPMRRRSYMQNWLELMQATAQNQLSKDANNTRYNLNYDYDRQEAARALGVDMSNARKPDAGQERDDAVKIIRYMQQHRLNTINDFVDHIAAKWKKPSNKPVV